jgi:dipeptidyl aminopeptidase/acylaminoacyl peptidase
MSRPESPRLPQGVADLHRVCIVGASYGGHVALIKAPVLIVRSRQGTVVAPSQSVLMAAAIRSSGGSVTVVTLQGEEHWLSRSATRIAMLKALDSFFADQLH